MHASLTYYINEAKVFTADAAERMAARLNNRRAGSGVYIVAPFASGFVLKYDGIGFAAPAYVGA